MYPKRLTNQSGPNNRFEYQFRYTKFDCGDTTMENKTFLSAVRVTEQLLNDVIFMCESRLKPTYFTRKGNNKLEFTTIILFCLNFVKKTLQLELDNFFDLLNPTESSITKQGFSLARRKISPNAFIKLADTVTGWFYSECETNTFMGYRLSAIDATIFELNNSERLRDAFGTRENQSKKYARAFASCIYDIENNLILTSKITNCYAAERDVAIELIEKLKVLGLRNDLILFDRGYPSREFIAYLDQSNIKFLIRCPSTPMKEIRESKAPNHLIELKINRKVIVLRVLRFMLDSGVEEILVTNLIDDNLGIQEFKKLYFKRWGIEVKYMELKSRLQIENISGDTPIAVEQDFYASIYLANMVALLKHEANNKISTENEGKNLKYDYQVNTNILIGKLKDSFILLLMEHNPKKREAMFYRLIEEIARNQIPIRPGRRYPRNMRLRTNNSSLTKKRCL